MGSDHIDRSDEQTVTHRHTATIRESGGALALWVLYSPDPEQDGQIHLLSEGILSLGRRVESPGVSFQDPLMSRRHATVVWDPERGGYLVVDAGSRNGTRLNGERVPKEVLSPGDVVRIGDTLLLFDALELSAVGWQAPEDVLFRGRSPALRKALREIERVAPTDLNVLVLGATGTGKELAARELHRQSGRSGPFMAVNCAAIPAELLESELFGHRKGAFSGATQDRKGMIRSAARGTLFLDEIGEMSLPLQAKLLRVLDEKRVRPVGGSRDEAIDVRFVFATNRDLAEMMDGDAFRADLFARVNQWTVRLAPLRERPHDQVPILQTIVARHGAGKRYVFSGDFLEAFVLHDWPYNARELIAATRRALVLLPDGGVFRREHLPDELRSRSRPDDPPLAAEPVQSAGDTLPPAGSTPTAKELERLLHHCAGNVSEVARTTARDRVQVYRWLRKHGLDPARYRRSLS